MAKAKKKAAKPAKKTAKKAAALYRRSCDARDAIGCFALSELTLAGDGVTRSEPEAERLKKLSCAMGYELACPPKPAK